ncbi:hypothetical protein BH23GEM6_BH23GEM6_18470 [soil metagenome]
MLAEIARSAAAQIRALRFPIAAALAASLFLVAVAIVLAVRNEISVASLFRDPLDTFSAPAYIGVMSGLGVILWISAAATCGFGYLLLRERDASSGPARFLLASAGITTLLCLDDFLLLHEQVFPYLFGIGEKHVYLVYVVLMAVYLWRSFRTILQTDFLLLGLAFAFLGGSVVADAAPFAIYGRVIVEDVLKFVGITFWLLYFVRTARSLVLGGLLVRPVRGVMEPRPDGVSQDPDRLHDLVVERGGRKAVEPDAQHD